MNDRLTSDLMLDIEETIYEAQPGEIIEGTRQRTQIDEKELSELIEDIKQSGQHTPGLCYRDSKGRLCLIFGGRRRLACERLGISFRYQLTTSLPNPYVLQVVELSENLKRSNLSWRDEADAKAKLHRLFQEQYGETSPGKRGGHGLKDTAEFLNRSYGSVAEDVELAQWAESIPEVSQAKTRNEAKKIVARLKEAVTRDIALDQAREKAETQRSKTIIDPSGTPTTECDFQDKLCRYDELCIHGELESELPAFRDLDVVIFDPPWGVDYDSVGKASSGQKAYEDAMENFARKFPEWLELLYASMAENSHLYCFFGIVHASWVYDMLEVAGFTVNRIPILWHKEGSHRTRNPKVWPGRCYEPIAYARKGSKPLFKMGAPDIIPTPPPTPSMKKSHPSAKHPLIYKELLERSAFPGDKVLDPMAGSGMFGVACEALSSTHALDWKMIEKDLDHRNLAIFNLARGYDSLVKASGEELTLPEDFRELKPGSKEWSAYWEAHPEEQKEMLEWRMENKG
jgi:ParB/RepB/Spo0J family partition protein